MPNSGRNLTRSLHLRLTPGQHGMVMRIARRDGQSAGAVLRRLITELLGQPGRADEAAGHKS